MSFGDCVRHLREQRRHSSLRYELRETAKRVGIRPSYLNRIEQNSAQIPSEDLIRRLAADLGENPDVLLAAGGLLARDVSEAITERPFLFAELIRNLADLSDQQLMLLAREIHDSQWRRERR